MARTDKSPRASSRILYAPLRRPTLAPIRTARNASATPSRASPNGLATASSMSSMMRRYPGWDPIETRAGFASLLDRIEGNGVRTVIVEDASRFARELMAQELGITLLISRWAAHSDGFGG